LIVTLARFLAQTLQRQTMNCAVDGAATRRERQLGARKKRYEYNENTSMSTFSEFVSDSTTSHSVLLRRSGRARRPRRVYDGEISNSEIAETLETSETVSESESSSDREEREEREDDDEEESTIENNIDINNNINNNGHHNHHHHRRRSSSNRQYSSLVAFDAARVRQLCARGGSECSLRWARRVSFNQCTEEYVY
jgi:hypothetical protein